MGRDSIRDRFTPRTANCSSIASSAPASLSGRWTTRVVLSAPVRRRHGAGVADDDEPGLRGDVVRDVRGERDQAVGVDGGRRDERGVEAELGPSGRR